jgi:uncharacterized Ntn-hydrolase superfamily protein
MFLWIPDRGPLNRDLRATIRYTLFADGVDRMKDIVATFSIVARDPQNGDLGVAVASKFLAVGAVVPWARAGAGAIATQALANIAYGPDGLALLERGRSAQEVLDELLAADEQRDHRQVGVVDARGGSAAHTGKECLAWAGHLVGAGFTVQGNILAGAQVIQAMAAAFAQAPGELAERLLAALRAGDEAGGDRRGRQSAALYVARAGGSYGGLLDRYIDLRVDDHTSPVPELARLLRLHRFYLTPPRQEDLLPIDATIGRELQELLTRAGYYHGPINGVYDAATRAALEQYGGVENLEERLISVTHIDRLVLDYMREAIGTAPSTARDHAR